MTLPTETLAFAASIGLTPELALAHLTVALPNVAHFEDQPASLLQRTLAARVAAASAPTADPDIKFPELNRGYPKSIRIAAGANDLSKKHPNERQAFINSLLHAAKQTAWAPPAAVKPISTEEGQVAHFTAMLSRKDLNPNQRAYAENRVAEHQRRIDQRRRSS